MIKSIHAYAYMYMYMHTCVHTHTHTHSTIRQQEEGAKKILGEKLYWDLDEMIYKLMDGCNFLELTSKKNGPTTYKGMITRDFATCIDGVADKSTLPPFRGHHYHEIFGIGKGRYSD